MSRQRQHGFASSFLIAGLLVTLMSLGGTWGSAYGQSAGPAPTPIPGGGLPPGPAEGIAPEAGVVAPPTRRTAVAGEAGESAEAGIVAEVPVAAVPNEGVAVAPGAVPTLLAATGADSSPLLPLFITGVILFAIGGTLFLRARRTR